MYSPKYSKAQSCAYFCSKNVLVALNTLYIVSTRWIFLILGGEEATFASCFEWENCVFEGLYELTWHFVASEISDSS